MGVQNRDGNAGGGGGILRNVISYKISLFTVLSPMVSAVVFRDKE